jgi:hypothetical protein
VPCTFTAAIDAPGGGTITGIATDGSGVQVESAPVPFNYTNAVAKEAANAPTCAFATTVRGARGGMGLGGAIREVGLGRAICGVGFGWAGCRAQRDQRHGGSIGPLCPFDDPLTCDR